MLTERFWNKVNKLGPDDCWTWKANTCQGYGHIRMGDKVMKAHRLSYIEHKGPIPEGKIIMHICDNRRCVNPAHLEIGTPADNNKDRDNKGRHIALKGTDHGMSKLTEQAVKEIKQLQKEFTEKKKQLAKKYGVTTTNITEVMNGKSWLWLK